MLTGYKTYIAAAGLLGLALYRLSVGEYDMAVQALMQALMAAGLRSAISTTAKPAFVTVQTLGTGQTTLGPTPPAPGWMAPKRS